MALIPSGWRRFPAAFALAGLLAAAGCGAAVSGRVYVRTGPPVMVVERVPPPPGPGFVWVPGFYRWNGRDYVWVNGRFDRPPRASQRWVAGHWKRDSHGWYWVDGHWR